MSIKVISFSIFGNKPIYNRGVIHNVKLAHELYPTWLCYVYHSIDTHQDIIDELNCQSNCKTFACEGDMYSGLFWRFRPLYDEDVAVWVSRDADSRLSLREKYAVDKWLTTDKTCHLMRDSANHCYEIMAGMFGINNLLYKTRYQLLSRDYSQYLMYRDGDQRYLIKHLWKLIYNDHVAHDHWHVTKKFCNFDTDNKLYGNGIANWIINKEQIFPGLYSNQSLYYSFEMSTDIGLYVGQKINDDNTLYESDDTTYEYLLRGIEK